MNKKAALLAGILALSMAACSQSQASAPSSSESESAQTEFKDPVVIAVHLGNGMGQVAFAEEGKTPEFDNEINIQSIVNTVERGSVVELDTKADENYQFLKWTKNGEYYSADARITVTVTEDVEYRAHFISTFGYEGKAVDSIDQAKTIGDVLALGYIECGTTDSKFGIVTEKDGIAYRLMADISEADMQKIFDLDFDDPDYNKKYCDIIAPLAVTEITNLTDMIPAQSELDKLIGKTGGELIEEGYTCGGYNTEDKFIYMTKAPFRYFMYYEGEIHMDQDDEAEAIKDAKITGVKYDAIENALDF